MRKELFSKRLGLVLLCVSGLAYAQDDRVMIECSTGNFNAETTFNYLLIPAENKVLMFSPLCQDSCHPLVINI